MFLFGKRACRVVGRINKRFASVQKNVEESKCNNENNNDKNSEKSSELGDNTAQNYIKNKGKIKVGIIGGGMTPVFTSLLLKQCKYVQRINLADTGDDLAAAVRDLNHIDTSTRIKYYGKSFIGDALFDVDIVALMDENDFVLGMEGPLSQFSKSSSYVYKMGRRMVESCPSALVVVFARPVTATLPLLSEVYRRCGWWNPNRIVGSVAIDSMRIESMTASLLDLDPSYLTVPIVGGADPCTVVPLFSRAKPVNHFSPEHETTLIHRLRSTDKELASSINSSQYRGPCLSSGAAAAKFIALLAGALSGRPNLVRSAYVRSDVLPICRFFSNELLFGCNGVEKNYGLPKVSPLSVELIEQSIPHINKLTESAIEAVRTASLS